MNAATAPVQRPADARLLAADGSGQLRHLRRSRITDLLRPGDLLVANDAATLPASLSGTHSASGETVEVRLAGRSSLDTADFAQVTAVVFGRGDHHTPTEERPLPPALHPGDRLELGPLRAEVEKLLDHPRLVRLAFSGTPSEIWRGIATHGRPIQYAHIDEPLALWDVWTRVASLPVAFEPPSAGFLLDWSLLDELRRKGVGFATLTHAAGISSTGDPALDRRLPFDEPYHIPAETIRAIEHARARGGRIVALGTTVTRALEHAASLGKGGAPRAGNGLADQRIGPGTELRIVDVVVSGAHEPGESHHELLHAFVGDEVLRSLDSALEEHGYLTHEFGDSVLIERWG